MKGFLIGLVIVVLIMVVAFASTYNGIISKHETVSAKWAQVENQLQRRNDLIPNLVNTVKGYAAHEKTVFEDITKARSQWANANTLDEKVNAASNIDSALARLMVVVENYPNLKANQNFLAVQEELASTENKIAFARQAYNDQTMFFNNRIQMFPSNIVAGIFSFTKRDFFEVSATEEREAPKVSF